MKKKPRKIRYAVVGLGHIAQTAVLPAFGHARSNSTLAALVSGTPSKREALSKKYNVPLACGYEGYDALLAGGEIDAVYIALPNDLHREFAIRAAKARVHVLCEKPLALSREDCEEMIGACEQNGVRLMTAYRLHFEKATLEAFQMVREGKIGTPRIFSSTFSMQVTDRSNIRLKKIRGGGPLYDLGIYCINQARNLFQEEPEEVCAFETQGGDRFEEVPEMTTGALRFPGGGLAMLACSFGASDSSVCQIIGTHGDLRIEPAFEYSEALRHRLTLEGKSERRTFSARDQFAPEIISFSSCILEGREPEPSGVEGLADVRVIEALQRSAEARAWIHLEPFRKLKRPTLEQEIWKPRVKKPALIEAVPAHST